MLDFETIPPLSHTFDSGRPPSTARYDRRRPLRAVNGHSENATRVFRHSLYAIARPSVICLSVTLVRPTQAVEIFGNISSAFDTLAIH